MRKKVNLLYFSESALDWSKAVIYEYNRLDKASDVYEMVSKGVLQAIIDDDTRMRRRMEEYFWIMATKKAIIYLSETSKYSQNLKDIVDRLCKKIDKESIIDIRNMREHDNEYVCGKGFSKEKYIKYAPNLISDAVSTYRKDGKVLLGGRIDAEQVVNAFESEIENIERECKFIIEREMVKKERNKVRIFIEK